MKNTTILVMTVFMFNLFSCNVENIEKIENVAISESLENRNKTNFKVTESGGSDFGGFNEHCKTVNLIAGQNHIAGTVSVDVDGDNLIITYTTNDEWALDATHLSVSSCEEGGFPSTNSGNPKIGNFEYSSTHVNGTTEVIYTISLDDVTNDFCFAAHAEVSGPTQETAWAEGSDFGGRSWAMYVESTLSECNNDDGGGGGIG